MHSPRSSMLMCALPDLGHFGHIWTAMNHGRLFAQATQDPDSETANAVIRIPGDEQSANFRSITLETVSTFTTASFGRSPTRDSQAPRQHYSPKDPQNILVPPLFVRLQSPFEDEITAAAAVVLNTYSKTHQTLIGDTFREAFGDRKYLSTLHSSYLDECDPNLAKQMIPCTLNVLSALTSDRFSITRRLELMFAGLFWVCWVPLRHVIQPFITSVEIDFIAERFAGQNC